MGFGAMHLVDETKRKKYKYLAYTFIVILYISTLITIFFYSNLFQIVVMIATFTTLFYFTTKKLIIVPLLINVLVAGIIIQFILLLITNLF